MDIYILVPLICVAMAVLDFCYGEYTKSCADRAANRASCWAVALYLVGVFVVVNVVADYWLAIPAAVGSWIGTQLSIRYGK
jgi:hypothetical protein